MSDTIPLAKPLNLLKMELPAYLSIKHDGVPIKITFTPIELDVVTVTVESRSGKPLPSVEKDILYLYEDLVNNGLQVREEIILIAEVTHVTLKNFKDISGLVRKKLPQKGFIYNFFDYSDEDVDNGTFSERLVKLHYLLEGVSNKDKFREVVQLPYSGLRDLEKALERERDREDIEGFILKSSSAKFKPGSRSWDYQKVVFEPTVDLNIIGVNQAFSKDGKPKGMVGSLVAEYKGREIKVSAGKMTHGERKSLWQKYLINKGTKHFPIKIATVKYKKDDSYTSPRQPTFQHWRPDKVKPSYN